jgi:hypothetical protein
METGLHGHDERTADSEKTEQNYERREVVFVCEV